jgi:hypothetical protein
VRRALLALALIACGGKKDDAPGAAPASPRDDLIATWKAGNLEPSAFAPTPSPIAKDCAAGTVVGVDVLVCNLDDGADPKKVEAAGYAWVGQTTGTVQIRGKLLIAAADRKKADVNGRTINALIKLAPK